MRRVYFGSRLIFNVNNKMNGIPPIHVQIVSVYWIFVCFRHYSSERVFVCVVIDANALI